MGLVCVPVRYVRREHLRLFLSFFLLLRPALEGDSSLSLAWLDILEELCWLKWLGTWRANPPWEAKLALQPPTTHYSRAQKTQGNDNNFSNERHILKHVILGYGRVGNWWLLRYLLKYKKKYWNIDIRGNCTMQPDIYINKTKKGWLSLDVDTINIIYIKEYYHIAKFTDQQNLEKQV